MTKIIFSRGVVFAAALMAAGPGLAVPQLQLGIAGATYDSSTQTAVAQANPFTLYAFLDPNGSSSVSSLLADTYYISAALFRKDGANVSTTGASLGSFSYNLGAGAVVVPVTSGMTFGTPPLDAMLAIGGLPGHGVFPTYFSQFGFQFASNKDVTPVDVQNNPSLAGMNFSGNGTGTGMYFKGFQIDVGSLDAAYGIHFDLYSTTVMNGSIVDVNKFAPFSHDAQSCGGTVTSSGCTSSTGTTSTGTTSTGTTSTGTTSTGSVPAPGSAPLVALGLGVLGAGFVSRRRRQPQLAVAE